MLEPGVADTDTFDATKLLIVITVDVEHEEPSVYCMVAVPAAIVVISPETGLIVAVVAPLIHTPPLTGLLSVEPAPMHISVAPEIMPGDTLTVTTTVAAHPLANV